MSAPEKIEATAEHLVDRSVRKTAHAAVGHRTAAVEGVALEARGKVGQIKEEGKEKFRL
ncbi:hypothetical protein ACFQ9Q_24815 [Streptomyces virginiae]|uniref:hypothetical protein n=1 Tax=Streptomyces virginiae TaxID=1961 RepID=UPI0036BC6B5D